MKFEEEIRRDQVWLRGFFMGPTGSGKSKGALTVASLLFGGDLPITLINSEKGRGKLYADRFKVSYIGIEDEESLGPETWIRAFDLAEERNPGGIIVADSASHEYAGRDGILQRASRFGDWKSVRPMHEGFVERVQRLESHLIVCVRAKMQYEVTEDDRPDGSGRKRQTVTMLGVGPVQDKDFQYEFNLVGRFELATHTVAFSGHVDPLIDTEWDLDQQGSEVATKLEKWLSEGDPIEPTKKAEPAEIEKLRASLLAEGIKAERIESGFVTARHDNNGFLHPDYVAEQLSKSVDRVARKAKKAAEATQEPASGDESDQAGRAAVPAGVGAQEALDTGPDPDGQ